VRFTGIAFGKGENFANISCAALGASYLEPHNFLTFCRIRAKSKFTATSGTNKYIVFFSGHWYPPLLIAPYFILFIF
jgi:hypothetical protein